MQALHWLVDATSVSGLVIYCTGMAVVMGVLAWASHSIIDGKSDGGPSQAVVAADAPSTAHAVGLREHPSRKEMGHDGVLGE